jgi:hypothetical protein
MDIIKFSIENEANKVFPFLKLCQSQPMEAEDVFVIGNPKELEYSVSNGIISSIRNVDNLGKIIQTTTPISAGNSGSPLMNMKGEVLGVISFTLLEGQNLNFAISVTNFKEMEAINNYLFPSSIDNSNFKSEQIFKRFEWKTSSSEIIEKETMTFVKKEKDSEGNLVLAYQGIIASIDVEVSYTFVYDELSHITISPRRPWPNNPDKKDWPFGDSLEVIVKEYLTIQKKMVKLLGDNFTECVNGNYDGKFNFCVDDYDFKQDKSKFLISDDLLKTYKNLNEHNEVQRRWKILNNNTYYKLRIYKSIISPWTLVVNIRPINE